MRRGKEKQNATRRPLAYAFIRVCLTLFLLILPTGVFVLSLLGEDAQDIDTLAALVAKQISKTGAKTVAVAPFATLDARLHGLPKLLREQFELSFAQSGATLKILHETDLRPFLKDLHLQTLDLRSQEAYLLAALKAGADAVVLGHVEEKGKSLKLSIDIEYFGAGRRRLVGPSARLDRPAKMSTSNDAPVQDPETGVYLPGTGGVGFPECQACPLPSYTDQARSDKWQGVVLLQLTITSVGKATDIVIVKSAGHGLDEQALAAVSKWRFKPAKGPDGKPVPVRTTAEINFRLI
jgi:TonB family protein